MLRIPLGVVIFAHGAQKMLGVFGGHGFFNTISDWEKWFHLPPWITILVIAGEFFGSIGLIFGLATRFCAATIGLIMFGAIYFVHANHFYMNWYGDQPGEGFEYHILVLTIIATLLIVGGGKYSVDYLFSKLKIPTQ
jgi:putative oxidoreductase